MCVVQLLLFIPLLGVDGIRSIESRAGSGAVYPASPSCLLGSGFGVLKGCMYSPAMKPITHCNKAPSDQACYESETATRMKVYTRDVRSSQDYKALTESVTEAEGGGFGQSVSAGISYMKESKVSEESLSFFVGSSGQTEVQKIHRPGLLKLNDAAKKTLQASPQQFIAKYGARYVHSITSGGSFLGSVTLNSMKTGDKQDIKAFVDLSVSRGLLGASGSSKFQNMVETSKSKVSVFINAKWVGGGSDIKMNASSPEELNLMFGSWSDSFRKNPAKLFIQWRKWTDSEEVNAILLGKSKKQQALFNVPKLSAVILSEITKENAMVFLTKASVDQALSWKEVETNRPAKACLNTLRNDIVKQQMLIGRLDENDIFQIEEQWLDGDTSWFQAVKLRNRYQECVEGIEATTTPPPQPADVIVGVNSYTNKRSSTRPPGYIIGDINKGFGGHYVYIRPKVTMAVLGCDHFKFVRLPHGKNYGSDATGDLATGAGGDFRYIIPVGKRPHQTSVKKIWLTEKKKSNCTTDINAGRGGRYLYLCWSY